MHGYRRGLCVVTIRSAPVWSRRLCSGLRCVIQNRSSMLASGPGYAAQATQLCAKSFYDFLVAVMQMHHIIDAAVDGLVQTLVPFFLTEHLLGRRNEQAQTLPGIDEAHCRQLRIG